jgi:probable addiction module antidote protein
MKFAIRKVVVNDFGAFDFVTRVRIDVCICGFLIGNPNDAKLTAQLAINDWQHRNQTSKKASELVRKQRRKMTIKLKTSAWDGVESLDTEEDMAAYHDAALEDGDPSLIGAALGDVARAKGMTQIARDIGLGRASRYKALLPDGNSEFAMILKVINALGLNFIYVAPSIRFPKQFQRSLERR